jgi:hypothetical protein
LHVYIHLARKLKLKKLKRYLVILSVFSFCFGSAQYRDTLHNAFVSKKTFDGRYESKNSFSDGDRIEVVSFKLGVTFGKKISIGGGYAFLNTSLSKRTLLPDVNGSVVYKDNQLKFRYLCYYLDFVFHKSKRWQLSSQVEIGAGLSKFELLNTGQKNTKPGKFICLYNPAINIKFKIFKWLGLGGTVGYRFMLLNDKSIGKKLNSPLYSFGVLIWWDELALAVFPKSKRAKKWFGESEW